VSSTDIAIVTGGAGGIGQAVVAALRASGVRVGVLDRAEPAEADAAWNVDVTDRDQVADAVAAVTVELGPPTMLVCAAGVVSEHPLDQLDPEAWHRVVDVSLTGTYLAFHLIVPGMQARGRGSVVAVSSGYATSGYRLGGHYAAAKAGIEALTKSVAQEAGSSGVRVNAVAPGPVLTSFVDHIEDPDTWRRDREARIPLRRMAVAEDIVGPVAFLLGPDSGYITGQVLHVNGGLLMP
jgi:NAD(P)-dependent dehydrogenase (short-subunit alcohol dehydrogenase family)